MIRIGSVARRHLAFGVALAIGLLRPAGAQDASRQTTDLLNRYLHGGYARAVLDGSSSTTGLAKQMPKAARAWIDSAPGESQKRRLAAGALVLEITRERYEHDSSAWSEWQGAIDWTREEFRRSAPSDGERLWYRASVALGGRTGDRRWLDDQIVHAWRRFPSEPFFWVAKAIVLANAASEDGDVNKLAAAVRGGMSDRGVMVYRRQLGVAAADRALRSAIKELSPSLDAPEWGEFGEIHVAHRYLMLHEYDSVLLHAQNADRSPRRLVTRYLARTLAGMAYEGLGRVADASAAYRDALRTLPGQSAALRLAAISRDEEPEATDVIETSLTRADTDPLRLLPYGMYVFWPELTDQLHEAMQ